LRLRRGGGGGSCRGCPPDARGAERDRMQEKYKHLRGVTVYPSYTNFILIHYAGACALNDELIHQGIGVRSFNNAPRLEDTLRISMGRPDENDAVFRAIKDYVEART